MPDFSLWNSFVVLVGVMLVALLVAISMQEHRNKQSCTASGGEVSLNDCTLVFCGDGCILPACTWRCVYAQPEGAR